MRANKNGLSDLKRLHKAAAAQPATRPKAPSGDGRDANPRPKRTPAVVDKDDATLFRRAVKAVAPLRDTHRAVLPPVPDAPAPILSRRRMAAMGVDPVVLVRVSDQYTPAAHQGDDSCYVRTGCGPDLIKGLQHGKWPTSASLDLHGATLDEARSRLDQFLQSCITHRIKCVRIVHGKGLGSRDGESILKQNVRRWLTQIDAVLAYTECSEHDGGAGAVQLLLRVDEPRGSR